MRNIGPVQVWTQSDPKVQSTHYLDLDLQNWVRSTLSLAQTLGPMGSVRTGPRSVRARTGPRTVYPQDLTHYWSLHTCNLVYDLEMKLCWCKFEQCPSLFACFLVI